MSNPTDPKLLLDDPQTDTGLRSALSALRQRGPDAAAEARLSAAIGLMLPPEGTPPDQPPDGSPPPQPAPSAPALTGLAGSQAAKIIVALAISAGVAAIVLRRPSPPSPADRPVASPSVVTNLPAASSQSDLSPQPISVDSLPIAAPDRASYDRNTAVASSASSNGPGPSASTAVHVPTEGELLRQAQAALTTQPARSLELLQEHARIYPTGMMAQEREVMMVEAMTRLGRVDDARKRGRNFVEQNPDSAHRERIRQLTAADGAALP